MSSDQVTDRAKQTLESIKDLLEKAEETTHRALEKAAPALQRSIDTSMEAAGKGFSATMKSIDGVTNADQVKVLKAYRKVLAGQLDFVDARIKTIETKTNKTPANEAAV